jgi:hypothetical protein
MTITDRFLLLLAARLPNIPAHPGSGVRAVDAAGEANPAPSTAFGQDKGAL